MNTTKKKIDVNHLDLETESMGLENKLLSFFNSNGWLARNVSIIDRSIENEFNKTFSEYQSDRVRFCKKEKDIAKALYGIKVNKIEFVHNNEIFDSIVDEICMYKRSQSLNLNIDYEIINSIIADTSYKHIGCTISLPGNIAYVRIYSYKNGINIGNISVDYNYRGRNYGFVLMCLLFRCIILSQNVLPPISLECTGAVSRGNHIIKYPIQKQASFFRKFGFRVVKDEKKYGQLVYIRMELNPDKLDIDTLVHSFPINTAIEPIRDSNPTYTISEKYERMAA